ncbi:rubrerythrin family protein [Telmatobacter bradus]|uniref:rubrerythrin family protein n=1 Tax=Telmatobacter bradus TaxID=474953 RepID=UPI003B42BBFC
MSVAAENAVTVKNLLAAFEGESNAHAKYTAFAVKADEDGLHGAASLFRAAARAEQIHAANHARVIKQLGGEATCNLHPVEVKSSLENLKAALGGENYEIDTMYPEFLSEATERDNKAAIRTFTYALEAEKTHARLYGEAIALLAGGKLDSWIGSVRDFYVCTVCGYTSENEEEHERCPVCNLAWEKFEIVR